MRNLFFIPILLTAVTATATGQDSLYKEKYRPQYHFTPAHRWIGDPCGTIRYNGKYLAYSWGAATSDDLIHWKELNDHAITGVPNGVSTFTGSVVVDKNNTAGYGNGALIAAFTSFDENSKKQSQSIAFSHDDGNTYQYYDLNPVIDIWSTEFRDPTVIWDEESKQWVMLVAKALEKKVAFYGSSNLKHWRWLSEFGPMGDSEKSWECPDMFKLPVEGSDEKKWVLVLSVNWAREQYFIGKFDGEKFIPDNPDSYPLYVDEGLDYYASRVFQDFDNPSNNDIYTIGWINTWDYATTAPSTWGKGIWSIPRRLSLYESQDGLRLRQLPIENFASLRQDPISLKRHLKPGVTDIKGIAKMGNVYEMKVNFDFTGQDITGLNLCAGDGKKVTISYDNESRYLTIDRTNSTDADIPKFERIAYCKIPDNGNNLDLDIFVDKSTMEIFVNSGEKTFSLLTYASPSQTSANIFSLYGDTNVTMTTWPMNTIWENRTSDKDN